MVIFSYFCFWKCAEIPFLQCFLNINQNLAQKKGKNDNFSHFSKHKLLKKPVLLQLPLWPKIGVFQLVFFETKNIDVQQKP